MNGFLYLDWKRSEVFPGSCRWRSAPCESNHFSKASHTHTAYSFIFLLPKKMSEILLSDESAKRAHRKWWELLEKKQVEKTTSKTRLWHHSFFLYFKFILNYLIFNVVWRHLLTSYAFKKSRLYVKLRFSVLVLWNKWLVVARRRVFVEYHHLSYFCHLR